MVERLRLLDALFAEKVLGHKPLANEGIAVVKPGPHACGCPSHLEREALPPYTRSLDAVWEGVAKVGFFNIDYYADTQMVTANVEPSDDELSQGFTGSMAHPAEALVLACLRAVGVSEEELI